MSGLLPTEQVRTTVYEKSPNTRKITENQADTQRKEDRRQSRGVGDGGEVS